MMRAKTQLSMPQDIYIHTSIHTHMQTLHTLQTHKHAYKAFFLLRCTLKLQERFATPKEGVQSNAFVHSRALQLFHGATINS
ncbi:hypothetical protein AMTRI_Chr03g148020 [Amborella trichopoda]